MGVAGRRTRNPGPSRRATNGRRHRHTGRADRPGSLRRRDPDLLAPGERRSARGRAELPRSGPLRGWSGQYRRRPRDRAGDRGHARARLLRRGGLRPHRGADSGHDPSDRALHGPGGRRQVGQHSSRADAAARRPDIGAGRVRRHRPAGGGEDDRLRDASAHLVTSCSRGGARRCGDRSRWPHRPSRAQRRAQRARAADRHHPRAHRRRRARPDEAVGAAGQHGSGTDRGHGRARRGARDGKAGRRGARRAAE
jgi:hypothetical protein